MDTSELSQMNANIKKKKIKEQFINGINYDDMMTQIKWELTTVKKTSEITNKQVLAWSEEWKKRKHKNVHGGNKR